MVMLDWAFVLSEHRSVQRDHLFNTPFVRVFICICFPREPASLGYLRESK